jgi:toxin ParE1/3/4
LKLYWLPAALKNFEHQIGHIAKDSPKAAIEQGDRVLEQINQLVREPTLSGCAGRKKGARELVISRTSFIASWCSASSRVRRASRFCVCCTVRDVTPDRRRFVARRSLPDR